MPWARFDDDYLTNTKMLAADKDALLLHMASVVYCAKRLTDGFVPATALKALAVMGKVTEPDPAVANLVELNLWQVVEGGWQVHDYLVYNPSREQVEAVSLARAETGRLGGQRSAEARQAKSKQIASGLPSKVEAKSNPVPRTPYPVPLRNPEPESAQQALNAPADARPTVTAPPRYSAAFETFWSRYPAKGRNDKPGTYTAWQVLRPDGDLVDAMLASLAHWTVSERWRDGYIVAARRWLKERRWEDEPPTAESAAARASPNGHRSKLDVIRAGLALGGQAHDRSDTQSGPRALVAPLAAPGDRRSDGRDPPLALPGRTGRLE